MTRSWSRRSRRERRRRRRTVVEVEQGTGAEVGWRLKDRIGETRYI